MIEKLDHIGIAVSDLEDALRVYSDALGLKCTQIEEVSEQHVKVAFLPAGSVNLELVQSTDPESAIAKFIEKRGEGIQHIGFKVDNIEKALSSLKEKGVRLIDTTPRQGAGGSKIVFIHPKSARGVLVELIEK